MPSPDSTHEAVVAKLRKMVDDARAFVKAHPENLKAQGELAGLETALLVVRNREY